MRKTLCAVVLMLAVAFSASLQAEASLSEARELYVAASYDDALTMLSGLSNASRSLDERQSIDLYRTLCLYALGRGADAEKVIEAILLREPLYRPMGEELAPRVQTAFETARKKILPAVIQKQYAEAKSSFDKQDFPLASKGFAEVLKSLSDPDIALVSGAPPLSDIKTLATSFRDLSVKLTPPPEPPKVVEPKAPVRPLKAVYAAEDRDVVPPMAVAQRVPKYPANVTRPLGGVLEFVVDEKGLVQAPTMPVSIDSSYDQMVISAAKRWQYQPAMLDGKPVKYLKRLNITVSPTPPPQ